MSGYDVSHFDEFQGLEASAVRSYLLRHGWHQWEARYKDGSKLALWKHPDRKYNLDDDMAYADGQVRPMDLAFVVSMLADDWESGSVQKLLREMNPRMRKGMPSIAAWEAHGSDGGFWLAVWDVTKEQAGDFCWFSQRPIITTLRRYGDCWDWGIRGAGFFHEDGKPEKTWSFWPCDANGERVRWPADEDGKML